MEILIEKEANEIREKYISSFINTNMDYYADCIKNVLCVVMECVIPDIYGIA